VQVGRSIRGLLTGPTAEETDRPDCGFARLLVGVSVGFGLLLFLWTPVTATWCGRDLAFIHHAGQLRFALVPIALAGVCLGREVGRARGVLYALLSGLIVIAVAWQLDIRGVVEAVAALLLLALSASAWRAVSAHSRSIRAAAAVAACLVLVGGAVPLARRKDIRSWEVLYRDAEVGGAAARLVADRPSLTIAPYGNSFLRYQLMGRRLQHRVVRVQTEVAGPYQYLHERYPLVYQIDRYITAPEQSITMPPDADVWLNNLRGAGVDIVAVAFPAHIYHTEVSSLILKWIGEHSEVFGRIHSDDEVGLWQLRPDRVRPSAGAMSAGATAHEEAHP